MFAPEKSLLLAMPSSYYQVLGLEQSHTTGHPLSQQDIKLAYRQALLQHHPDKSRSQNPAQSKFRKYTVDEITIAFQTLSNAHTRSEYDRSLCSQSEKQKQRDTTSSQIGLETVDLDDLQRDEVGEYWHRGCRCGDTMGFVVTDIELEKEAEHGEIIVGCSGCSLALRVVFQQIQDS